MKALFILMPDGFRDEEFTVPKERMESAGVEVTVAGLREGECKGMLGMSYTPKTTVDEVSVDDFDALVIPGGSGSPAHLWDNQVVHQMVQDAHSKGKVVAIICLAPVALAKAGLLKGKNATVSSSSNAPEILKGKGANYLDEDVVVDGNIITARCPAASGEFAEKIIEKLLA